MERMFFPVTRREAERSGIRYSSTANKDALFPSQLRELRKKKGVSQETLSKVLGVSKSTIGLWETGDTLPDARYVRDLADYFEVSADYIVGKTDVTSTNSDLRNVCEYTGLSEKIITDLVALKSTTPRLLEFLNEPENIPYLFNLLTLLAEYNDCIIAESLFTAYVEKLEREDPDSRPNDHFHYIFEAGVTLTNDKCNLAKQIKDKINQIWNYELAILDKDLGDRRILMDLKIHDVAECRINRAVIDFLSDLSHEDYADML